MKGLEPYDKIVEVNEEARKAMLETANEGLKEGKSSGAYVCINNRLEGMAPMTIEAVVEGLAQP